MRITGKAGAASRAFAALALASLCTSGCTAYNRAAEKMNIWRIKEKEASEGSVIDSELGLSRSDYKKGMLPKRNIPEASVTSFRPESSSTSGSGTPDIAQLLVAPAPPSFGTDKLVTLSVTQDIPVRDVLTEMSANAGVDMELDPGITGGIILNVKDKPFSQVVDRIAKLAGLRYEYKENILRVERDLPYQKNYSADFINMVRSSQSDISINTQVLGGGGGGGGGNGLTGGSSNAITASYDGDTWKSVEEGLHAVLDFKPSYLLAAGAEGGGPVAEGGESNFVINRQAGVITVNATDAQHKLIEKYLNKVREAVSSQVLIEAKIVEVKLKDEFNTGINWGVLSEQNLGLQVSANLDPNKIIGSTSAFTLRGVKDLTPAGQSDLDTAVALTQTFGASRTLSSPRLHAMNNQQAVLTFAENFVYFTVKLQEEQNTSDTTNTRTTLTADSQLNTVPVGMIMVLQPSINLETQEVTMNVRPTLSRVTGKVSDPGVDIILARNKDSKDAEGVKSEIPVVEVREMDSIVKCKSGEVMVIGGLMRETNENEDSGIPFASDMPLLGHLFKSEKRNTNVVETVIFLKATIVPSQGVPAEDQRLYNTFMPNDPHPLTF